MLISYLLFITLVTICFALFLIAYTLKCINRYLRIMSEKDFLNGFKSSGFSSIPVGSVFDDSEKLAEEFAFKSAQLRDMDYSGFESSMDSLGDEYEEEDDSRSVVEKLKKLRN